jgi:hypothetical protein
LHHEQIYDFSYADICRALFACAENMAASQSVVLLTLAHLKEKRGLTL